MKRKYFLEYEVADGKMGHCFDTKRDRDDYIRRHMLGHRYVTTCVRANDLMPTGNKVWW